MIVHGILLPESVLFTPWSAVLVAFVSVNTLVYVTLSAMKCLPVIRPSAWRSRRYTRAQTRSIYPDAVEPGPGGR